MVSLLYAFFVIIGFIVLWTLGCLLSAIIAVMAMGKYQRHRKD